MYEESMRMPLVVRYPKKIKAQSKLEDIITNIDIAPTLLEMAEVDIPTEIQGRSFANNLQGDTPDNWRQSMYYHYYEYPFWHHVQPHYGIRTQRYKLIHFYYSMDVWELYDLEKDPNELNNLIHSEKHAKIVKKLKRELRKLKKTYKNNLSLEELRAITDTDFGGLESTKKNK